MKFRLKIYDIWLGVNIPSSKTFNNEREAQIYCKIQNNRNKRFNYSYEKIK